MKGDIITELELAHDKLWIMNSGRLSSFDGTTFINYTTANGLISDGVLGMTVTPSGTLWICTTKGISKFDGTKFVKVAYDIESDSTGRIYIINGSGRVKEFEVYESNAWTQVTPNIEPSLLNEIFQIKRTHSGELVLLGWSSGYYKVNYPLILEEKRFSYEGDDNVELTSIEIDQGKVWTRLSIYSQFPSNNLIFSSVDSILNSYFINTSLLAFGRRSEKNNIAIHDELIYVGTLLEIGGVYQLFLTFL